VTGVLVKEVQLSTPAAPCNALVGTYGESKTVSAAIMMRVKSGCGHAEDETYEFDTPEPMWT
jgi:hypothetical protein